MISQSAQLSVVDQLDAESGQRPIHLGLDPIHELVPILRQDREQGDLAEHTAQAGEDDWLQAAAESRLVPDRLPELKAT